ncbi:hypothetical protein B0T17DRAFT_49569 [Bombardia bombarda]|uniref:Uncharacterized protein n=1 Tax=Bombardia bombarda TaxID=252184 RepID=A0AA39XL43_9PEZI|nr:hypothetical protein B0T17DRAFT_49569 [Bombardia bombarda]
MTTSALVFLIAEIWYNPSVSQAVMPSLHTSIKIHPRLCRRRLPFLHMAAAAFFASSPLLPLCSVPQRLHTHTHTYIWLLAASLGPSHIICPRMRNDEKEAKANKIEGRTSRQCRPAKQRVACCLPFSPSS